MSHKRELEAAERHLAAIRQVVSHFGPKTVADLIRRGQMQPVPDGYPAGGATTRSTSSDTTSVEAAALADQPGPDGEPPRRSESDPVAAQLRAVLGGLAEAAGILIGVDEVLASVLAGPKERRSSVGACECCGATVTGIGEDRLKAGFDLRCHSAWRRAGYPERFGFVRDRRKTLALVPDKSQVTTDG